MARAEATIATTMPAMAPPDNDLEIVDCELTELDTSAAIVVVATAVSVGIL